MSELKTLKEICWENKIGLRDYMKLKSEAVNDIKIIEDAVIKQEDLNFLHKPTHEEFLAIKSYIIEKNNLSEKDLEEDLNDE